MYLSHGTIDQDKKFSRGASHYYYGGIAAAPPVVISFAKRGKL